MQNLEHEVTIMNHLLKHCRLIVFTLAAAAGCVPALSWAQGFQPLSGLPAGLGELTTLHAAGNSLLYLGAGGALFTSSDHGKNWKQVANLGPNVQVNDLFQNEKEIFVLTSDGVWKNDQNLLNWKPVFQPSNRKERNALAMARDPLRQNVFYLGTQNGLFKTENGGKTWAKMNLIESRTIRKIETDFETGEIFIAGEKGVHRSLPNKNFGETVYHTFSIVSDVDSDPVEATDEISDAETSRPPLQAKTILVIQAPEPKVLIGTSRGVFSSDDEGNHWEPLAGAGLLNSNITDLAYSDSSKMLFAGTANGIFAYDFAARRWKECYEGITAREIRRLILVPGENETLYVVTRTGIYYLSIGEINFSPEIRLPALDHLSLLQTLFRAEPSAGAIRKETIRYANVSNWKIRRWQWASRLKSLIPSFSVGKSFANSNNVDIDRGGTSDPDKFIFGPEDTSRSWKFDLDWQPSDLLFSSSQTSIDSREKMMVELRNDILNEVTRLYFERRHAQAEYVLQKPTDPMEQMNALLRIDELTANIDSLTDGYLTRQIEILYSSQPEFYELWKAPAKNSGQQEINGKVEIDLK